MYIVWFFLDFCCEQDIYNRLKKLFNLSVVYELMGFIGVFYRNESGLQVVELQNVYCSMDYRSLQLCFWNYFYNVQIVLLELFFLRNFFIVYII